MRNNGGPYFLELVTYRWRGHVGPREDEDVGVRRKDDLAIWKRRDPIRRLADLLVNERVIASSAVQEWTADIQAEIEIAWEQAMNDPYPPIEALMSTVWADRPHGASV
jgi:TPP-dependent pyruvate/acetoin dehydrogenase alpha subunit